MSVTMKNMGKMNASWGVCGFTSCFYHMWELEKATRPAIINAPRAYSVIAEIKTYLRMLQASGDQTAINAIEAFCRSFGGDFRNFTVEGYCERVSESVVLDEDRIKAEPLFSIGMPPDYVCDYLKRMWGYHATVLEVPPSSDPGGTAIVGMCVDPGTIIDGEVCNTLHNLLVHYLYRRDSKFWSWGMKPFESIEAAAKGGAPYAAGGKWHIGWVIQILKPAMKQKPSPPKALAEPAHTFPS